MIETPKIGSDMACPRSVRLIKVMNYCSTLVVPLSVRNLIRTIFGRDENAYKSKRLCIRVPLSVRCTLIRTIFGRAEVYG